MAKSKKIIIAVCISYYLILLILTLCARRIHNASLPRVTVGTLEFEEFDYYDENSDADRKSFRLGAGIPKEIYDNHKVYVIRKEIVNGEERNIAREVKNLEIGQSNEKYYEVLQGISMIDLVVFTGQEYIQDGSEVYVEEKTYDDTE
ncbi:MAG: hypothetical protein GX757_09160 [Clostridiales bacterium]|nr:hypothetical protein [Clostridiales bacterium]